MSTSLPSLPPRGFLYKSYAHLRQLFTPQRYPPHLVTTFNFKILSKRLIMPRPLHSPLRPPVKSFPAKFPIAYEALTLLPTPEKDPNVANLILLGARLQSTPADPSPLLNIHALDRETPLEDVFFGRQVTLSSFFAMQMVDVPAPFLKMQSLFNMTSRLPRQKFMTLLMRHGLKSRVMLNYSRTVNSLSYDLWASPVSSSTARNWSFVYSLMCSAGPLRASGSYSAKYELSHTTELYSVESDERTQRVLFEELEKFVPLFSFFLTKVDKQKRKHSRGKSGKYQVIWKYIPRYKRLLTVLRWLSKDVKFQRARTLDAKLYQSLKTFLFDTQSHLIPQLRQFVHTFVFQHHRKTLVRTLKASS